MIDHQRVAADPRQGNGAIPSCEVPVPIRVKVVGVGSSSASKIRAASSPARIRSAPHLSCFRGALQQPLCRIEKFILPNDLVEPVLRDAGQAVHGAGKLAGYRRHRIGIIG